jgi:hypothetical protein
VPWGFALRTPHCFPLTRISNTARAAFVIASRGLLVAVMEGINSEFVETLTLTKPNYKGFKK